MRVLLTGGAFGLLLGVFFGVELARWREAVTAVGIGFGAGVGIFALGATVRTILHRVDQEISKIKEAKGI